MSEFVQPKVGEAIDLPGIGKVEAVEKTSACTHSEGACCLAFSDEGQALLFVCNSRENLKHIDCSEVCYKKVQP